LDGNGHAVVIGGSIAGLCAARALRSRFARVTVLERDVLPGEPRGRRGTPQAWHNHFLLQRGRDAVAELFPGFDARFFADGGIELDPAYDAATCFTSGWSPRSRGAMRMLFSSRPRLELTIRGLLLDDPAVELRQGVRVTGVSTAGGAVTGVHHEGADGAGQGHLAADFVVDAAGRGSRAAAWMAALGHDVEVRDLDARVGYASRWYRWPQGDRRPWWRMLTVFPGTDTGAPDARQFLCSVFPIEDDAFIAVMGSWGLTLPTTNDDFERVAGETRAREFGALLAASTPLTDVHHTRSTHNVWRRFDRLAAPPARFVAVGDAVCAFNPIYAQGMSSASAGALMLRDLLRTGDPAAAGFPRAFYRRQAAFLRTPWALAKTRDGGYRHATGTDVMRRGLRRTLLQRYTWSGFEFVTAAGWCDEAVDTHVANLFNINESLGAFARNPRVLAGLAGHGTRELLGRSRRPGNRPPEAGPSAEDHSGTRYRRLRPRTESGV
jgi:2-polyprenyl-6-methoxyphenol hydroxylase-like FAD-dependent oxidoreductase